MSHKSLLFSLSVFFHEHSQFTRLQGNEEGTFLGPLYHFHPLRRHLDISRAITKRSTKLSRGMRRVPFQVLFTTFTRFAGTQTLVEQLLKGVQSQQLDSKLKHLVPQCKSLTTKVPALNKKAQMKRKERANEQNLKNLSDVLTDKRITIT